VCPDPGTPRRGAVGVAPSEAWGRGPVGGVGDDGVVDDVRQRLQHEREQTLERLASLTGDYDSVVAASLDTNADDEHDPEGTTIAFERSQIGALVRQVRHHLAELDAALARVDAGTYGACEACGSAIGDARLDALPAARTCITCASRRP
jgi:DnaK suppressor protein